MSLPAARKNYRYFRSLLRPSTKLLVLVKANAYGHGAVEFASMMQAEGADYLAVALPVEGIELRRAGISLPVLVLTAGTDFFPEIIDYRLEPGIPNLYTLKALCDTLDSRGISGFPIHIKLDSGMHRLGFVPEEIPELIDFLLTHHQVRVRSVYSHLAAAEDPAEDEFTLGQIRLFEQGAEALSQALGYKPMWHVLNSAGSAPALRDHAEQAAGGAELVNVSAGGMTGVFLRAPEKHIHGMTVDPSGDLRRSETCHPLICFIVIRIKKYRIVIPVFSRLDSVELSRARLIVLLIEIENGNQIADLFVGNGHGVFRLSDKQGYAYQFLIIFFAEFLSIMRVDILIRILRSPLLFKIHSFRIE